MIAKLIRVLVLLISVACLPSCMTIKITGTGKCMDKNPSTSLHVSETVHGSFWGFTWVEPELSKSKKGQELFRIDYHHNPLYLLASVATLGLYVPQGVEWWCGEPITEEGGKSLAPDKNKD